MHTIYFPEVGAKYNRLEIVEIVTKTQKYGFLCKCLCDCGTEKLVYFRSLRKANNPIRSCGCLGREVTSKRSITHGLRWMSEYSVWLQMKNRCNNQRDKDYPKYGGRGIKVCEQWVNSFETFLADMGQRPDKTMSLDRVDVNAGYSPENCRWADAKTQANNRRNNVRMTVGCVTLTLAEWAHETGLSERVVYSRYHAGKTPEQVIGTPSLRQRKPLVNSQY